MTCEETQKVFSPYLDGVLTGGARAATEVHLQQCPVCRTQLEETRFVVRSLALMERPSAPPDLVNTINDALLIERAARAARPAPVSIFALVVGWIEPRFMPYTVGAMASLILFVTVLSALRPQIAAFRGVGVAVARSNQELVFVEDEGGYDVTKPLTPENFAAMRTAFAAESPSINPNGALARLAWSAPTGTPGDDDMIVVADVYGNGQASLAAVVEPPRNPQALDELEDAFRKNAAFVPATLDRRPQTMRVVFVLQKMNVEELSY
jgi:hypothetical protein